MADTTQPLIQRDALIAGATGLIGRELFKLLLASHHYHRIHVLLRRPARDLQADERVSLHYVEYHKLTPMPPVDDVFIALGTTINDAGSRDAFRRVDYDAVLATARACLLRGAKRLVVVSALGAASRSLVFYNRVKGQMEEAISKLPYESVTIVQPSLLLGDRAALGQPERAGEQWAAKLLKPVMPLVPRGMRPIAAQDVARAMLDAALSANPGVHVLRSAVMQAKK
ncbi:NAD(P)H-binding protein [Piscinibacter terrae]|uniref:Nucleoside-diphosphate sugar epimerase n=1 Tax=Piscinibacter terrae TaxID=2496871 RepID=A0A3N7HSZ2_9BURK|nr:NAD(P)H-binding protein [Albitalea terrae]RQP25334.1 nucleoside-diphosphate sugar epimerase [Albitalea terrae]